MKKRREFTKPVAREINARATRPDGQRSCEVCGAIGIPLEIHHVDMDAMQVDRSRKLTASDGKLLCVPCHDAETTKQIPALAKAIRVSDRHTGVVRSAGTIVQRGFAPSRGPQIARNLSQKHSYLAGRCSSTRKPLPGATPRVRRGGGRAMLYRNWGSL